MGLWDLQIIAFCSYLRFRQHPNLFWDWGHTIKSIMLIKEIADGWVTLLCFTSRAGQGLKREDTLLFITWLIVFSICTRPRLGSVVLMKSTMDSRLSCCRIRGLWLPSRLKATLKMTSEPWRNNISGRGQKESKVVQVNKYNRKQRVDGKDSDVKAF